MRERWFGATGRRVPEIAVEGELDLGEALVLDDASNERELQEAHANRPADRRPSRLSAEAVKAALAHPEVAAALVPVDGGSCSTWICASSRMARSPVVATYSIVACDLAAGQWGVAVQSKFLAVGSVVPWAEPQVGAIATQSYANPRYGPEGLALLREGRSAEEVDRGAHGR